MTSGSSSIDQSTTVVIFGASGDLTRRQLLVAHPPAPTGLRDSVTLVQGSLRDPPALATKYPPQYHAQ